MNKTEKEAVRRVLRGEKPETVAISTGLNLFWLNMVVEKVKR